MLFRPTFRSLQLVSLSMLLVVVCVCTANAQRRGTERIARRDSDDLGKFLIESDTRGVGDSMFYRPTEIDTKRINIQDVRGFLKQFADGANRLYQQVDVEANYNARLRPYKSDALKLRARSLMLSQDAQGRPDLPQLASGVREIDTDWHQLSHDIQRLPQVPRQILTTVANMDRTSEQVEQAFQIKPQVDRRALLNEVMAMRADFDNLIDDIELELGSTQEARALVRTVRSIRQQAVYSADLIAESGEYDRIVTAFQRAETDWEPVARRLATSNSRYIQRSVRRIVSAGNRLKQLLWLDSETDMSQLIETASGMRKHVDEFFVRTPLLLMLKLQDPHAALDSARNFLDACDVYTEQVTENAGQETLMEVFKDVQVTGDQFVQEFRPLPSKAAQTVLADIRRDLVTLREQASQHNQGTGFDRDRATELAAEIEAMADHIDYDLQRWLRNSTSSGATATLKLSKQFVENSKRLQVNLMNRVTLEQAQQSATAAFRDWRRLRPVLQSAPEEDRQHMANMSSKLTDAFIDLMLPIGL